MSARAHGCGNFQKAGLPLAFDLIVGTVAHSLADYSIELDRIRENDAPENGTGALRRGKSKLCGKCIERMQHHYVYPVPEPKHQCANGVRG